MIIFIVISLVVLLIVAACNVLLWKYPLGRQSRAIKLAAGVAMCVSITVVTVVIIMETAIVGDSKLQTEATSLDYEDVDSNCSRYESTGNENASTPNRCQFYIVPRSEWVSSPSTAEDSIVHPVEYVAVTSTNTNACFVRAECALALLILHQFHSKGVKGVEDGFNFFVGGDGQAYEGRGWDISGARNLGLNESVMGIGLVGTFTSQAPPRNQVQACKALIKEGVSLKKISPEYKVISMHRNIGPKLLEELRKWPRWFETLE